MTVNHSLLGEETRNTNENSTSISSNTCTNQGVDGAGDWLQVALGVHLGQGLEGLLDLVRLVDLIGAPEHTATRVDQQSFECYRHDTTRHAQRGGVEAPYPTMEQFLRSTRLVCTEGILPPANPTTRRPAHHMFRDLQRRRRLMQ